MRKALWLLLPLVACSSPIEEAATDQFGNVYPLACRRDLSFVTAPVIPTSPQILAQVAEKRGLPKDYRLMGLSGTGLIMIDDTVLGWKRDDLIHHERCHMVAPEWRHHHSHRS
jgi:hypothetical protein